MRRMYSGPELLELDGMLPKYVNSSTESKVLPSTIIGDGVDPEPRFWSFVWTKRPEDQTWKLLHPLL